MLRRPYRPTSRLALRAALAFSAVSLLALPVPPDAHAQTAEEVMDRLADLGIDFMEVAVSIADRQSLGERAGVIYLWDRERSPDDATARAHLLGVEHLVNAGIPAVNRMEVDYESGILGPNRFRMGGVLRNLDIRGDEGRYEVRATVDWELFDARAEENVWKGSSRGLARGAVLGENGQQPNALLDAVLKSLDKVLEGDVPDAIDRAEG